MKTGLKCLLGAGVLVGLWACSGPADGPSNTANGNGAEASTRSAAAPKELSPEELDRYLADEKNLYFLDVREPMEIKTLGSIEGYVNIPVGELEGRLNEIPKDKLIITA